MMITVPSVRRTARAPLGIAASVLAESVGELAAATHLVRTGAASLRSAAAPGVLLAGTRATSPVMLVHGLGADSSCFQPMAAELHRAGHTVYLVNYSCIGMDVASCGRVLAAEAARLRDRTGAAVVHVVAHSLGGVVLRWAVEHTRMGEWVGVGVTLGSPHRGSPWARYAPSGLPGLGLMIRQLRPTPEPRPDSPRPGSTMRWVAVAAQLDWIVPPRFACLPESPDVRNVVLAGGGHLSLPADDRCVQLVRAELAAADRSDRVGKR